MKKFVIALAVLCLVLVLAFGAGLKSPVAGGRTDGPEGVAVSAAPVPSAAMEDPAPAGGTDEAQPADTEAPAADAQAASPEASPSTVPEEPAVKSGRLNYDALYALHDPDEKVLKVGDREERWGDYFYVLYTECGQIENYFDSMSAYYGMQFGWSDPIKENPEGEEGAESETFKDAALEGAENLMIQLAALEKFAEDNGVELDEDTLQAIEEQKKQDVVSTLGEEGTQEQFFEHLKGIYLTPEMYDRIVTQNYLYQESFNRLYGKDAAQLSDEAALSWLEDNDYVAAAHILFLNTDEETGEALSDEQKAEKQEKLRALQAELAAIEDPMERREAFLKMMNEVSEDPGKERYPEGYTFTQGTMVQPFDAAARELEEFAISDLVETDYGWHILLRLPLNPDGTVEFNSTTGEARTGRMLAANQEYSEKLQAVAESLKLEWLEENGQPDLLAFVTE